MPQLFATRKPRQDNASGGEHSLEYILSIFILVKDSCDVSLEFILLKVSCDVSPPMLRMCEVLKLIFATTFVSSVRISPLIRSVWWRQLNYCCCALVPSILSEYTVWRLSSPRMAPLEKESKRTGDVTFDSIAVSVFVVILVDFDKY